MKKNIPDKIASDSRASNEGKRISRWVDSFFHKPAGVSLICLLFFGLTVGTFMPALQTDFQLFDDGAIFLNNTHVNTGLNWQNLRWALFSTDYSYSYPLTRISHMLDFTMYGAKPWGHHLTNVLIHAANGILLFLVLKRMTGALWRSLIVALLFALHPLRVESVAWVSERKDVMSAFFGLLALWTYARYAGESRMQGGRTKLFYGLTLLFFAFALMSKSMLVTFPFLLLVLDFWPLKRMPDLKHLLLEKIPFFVLVMLAGIATWFASKGGSGTFILHLPWSMRLETAVMGYARYLGLMFWPAALSAMYPYPAYWPTGQLLCAMLLFLGVSALAFVRRHQQPYFVTGWLWYVGTLVPVIGLIPLGGESICTRFTYIPMMGALVFLVWGIDDLTKCWHRRAAVIVTVVALAVAACVMQTRAEIVYWKDSVTLYNRAIAVTTNNFMAHYCLANVLPSSKFDEALDELQTSVTIYPDYFEAQLLLGDYLLSAGRLSDAAIHYEKAIQIKPQNSWAYHNLGSTFLKMGRESDAVPPLLKAISLEPQNARYKDDLGMLLFSRGPDTGAVSSFLSMARSDPAGFGNFLQAIQFDTNHVPLISNLALSFATNPDPGLRNGKYAVRLATRACEMTGFRTNNCVGILAAAYAEDSRFDEAISNAQLACSLTFAAGQEQQLQHYQALLELFRSHQSYHEPPPNSEATPK